MRDQNILDAHRDPSWLGGILTGICLGLALVLNTVQISGAGVTAIPCAVDEAGCLVSGGWSAASSAPSNPQLTDASTPSVGALLYNPDLVRVEEQARAALQRGLTLRESISPYRPNNDFSTHLRNLDAESGFASIYQGETPYNQDDPATLIEIVDAAETDLRLARDLYAYLLVYAPEADDSANPVRFRADPNYTSIVPAGYDKALCDPAQPEDPYPADPNFTGQVLPPVVDWCNFAARLRQSVREAANVRMIFGQEFEVDALGVNFSGSFFGGEQFVIGEVAQMRAARHQYELAEQTLESALRVRLGSGCLVSDFYTQTEWSLLSRASERQTTMQYHIASRLSYLGINTPQGVSAAEAQAQAQFRQGAHDGYLKTVAMSALVGAGETAGCAAGERPDGSQLADLVLALQTTRRQSRELTAGRNIFGLDVTATPMRRYQSSAALNCETNSGERGLWDEAMCLAQNSAELQEREELQTRLFDIQQDKLRETVQEIRNGNGTGLGLDTQIYNFSGCDLDSFGNDDAQWFACIEQQATIIQECIGKAHLDNSTFDSCMVSVNDGTDARTGLLELRSIYLDYLRIVQAMENINARVQASADANAIVTDALSLTGALQTAADASGVLLNSVGCIDFSLDSFLSSTVACGAAGGISLALTIAAGTASTDANISIENAQNELAITNLLLDQTELLIEAQAAFQAFQSKRSEVQGNLDVLNRNVRETKRMRAWFNELPANDPSYRIVRDSARIELATELEKAARMAYLAARRAEYEFADSLFKYNFRISDIYRARTAQDIIKYLNDLQSTTGNMAAFADASKEAFDLPTISVAQHVLLLSDDVIRTQLIGEGIANPTAQQIATRRASDFRAWVADNTVTGSNGKPQLHFNFPTSLVASGLFDNVILEGYDALWRLQLGGKGTPYVENTGVSINLVTDQAINQLTYRSVTLTQGGMTHVKSHAGCIFDYRVVAPAALLGLYWPVGQNAEATTSTFFADVANSGGQPAPDSTNYRTGAFEGLPVSSTNWSVIVRAGNPDAGQSDMDLQQLTDIELNFSTVKSNRTEGNPEPNDCIRIDW